jgi:hypothetical protein
MKFKLLAIAVVSSISLAACSSSPEPEQEISQKEDVNIKEMVYDFSMRNITDQSAVILQDQLIVEAGGEDIVYDISGEDFFASIAPYISKTHP